MIRKHPSGFALDRGASNNRLSHIASKHLIGYVLIFLVWGLSCNSPTLLHGELELRLKWRIKHNVRG